MRARARSAIDGIDLAAEITTRPLSRQASPAAPELANQSPTRPPSRAARADQNFEKRRRFLGRMDRATMTIAHVDDGAHEPGPPS